MKKIFSITAWIFLVTMISFTSCAPEEEGDEDLPDTSDSRTRFTGSYNCTENIQGQPTPGQFTVHINLSTANTTDIWIENFNGLGFSNKATAQVNGNNFNIAQQTVAGNSIKGSGSLVGTNTINMSYTVNNGSTIDSCTATLARQ